MPTQFANTLNNHPIYADRAEKDAAGNNIATTYQEKLTAGTGITIDSSNVISATGGGGGSTYTAGNAIDITSDVISVQVTSPNAGDIVTLDCDGHLVDSGVAPSDLQPKLTAGTNITIDANNVISASGGGGGGTSYTAGTGIDISGQNAISVKIDGSTITTNASGQLVANGGGGGGSSSSTYKFVIEQAHSYNLFTYGDFVFTVSLNENNEEHLCVSSSTVGSACIARQTIYSYSTGGGNPPSQRISGMVMGCTHLVQYTPTSLSSAVQLFEITDADSTSYPYVNDFTMFYEKSGSAYVLNIKTFTIYTEIIDPYQGSIRTRTLYISVG